jgi:TatA/E family protein of Tat protein translocase
MFGSLGGPEVILIFVLALLLFGPRKLPEIGRMLGKSIAEFRKATTEFRSTLEREVQLEELKGIGEVGGALKAAGQETATVVRDAAKLTVSPPDPPAPEAPSGERPPAHHGTERSNP